MKAAEEDVTADTISSPQPTLIISSCATGINVDSAPVYTPTSCALNITGVGGGGARVHFIA